MSILPPPREFDLAIFKPRMSEETAKRFGPDVHDAILAAHEIGAVWVVHGLSARNGGRICGYCLTDILYSSWLTTGEAIRLSPCIICNDCFGRLFGMTIYDYKLKSMRELGRRRR